MWRSLLASVCALLLFGPSVTADVLPEPNADGSDPCIPLAYRRSFTELQQVAKLWIVRESVAGSVAEGGVDSLEARYQEDAGGADMLQTFRLEEFLMPTDPARGLAAAEGTIHATGDANDGYALETASEVSLLYYDWYASSGGLHFYSITGVQGDGCGQLIMEIKDCLAGGVIIDCPVLDPADPDVDGLMLWVRDWLFSAPQPILDHVGVL